MSDQQAFNNALHCGDFHDASELAERMNNDLIPRTPELHRLREFLLEVGSADRICREHKERETKRAWEMKWESYQEYRRLRIAAQLRLIKEAVASVHRN